MRGYWVFQDTSFKRACIHRSSCKVRQRAQESGTVSEGAWHGAYPSYDEARRSASQAPDG
jgi:hypothetical protein